MSINHAILGMLSYRPLTGYDLKKIMQESPFMYWSGNNNQIYKALLGLNNDGFVTSETQHQDGAPSKKVYTITEAGLAELKRWSLTAPEAPELKKAFLVQLAWAWQLSGAEMQTLLEQYAQEVQGQLFIAQSKAKAGHFAPDRTPREHAVWGLIHENIAESYQQELRWVGRVQEAMALLAGGDGAKTQATAQHPAVNK